MLKLLVAVDGSDHSVRTIDYLLGKLKPIVQGAEIHLLNVQPPVPGGSYAASVLGKDRLKQHHEQEGRAALAPAEQKLKAGGLSFTDHIVVGDAGSMIAQFAKEKGCDQIVMGTHGGGATGMLLGSVAMKVVNLTTVPVLLVK